MRFAYSQHDLSIKPKILAWLNQARSEGQRVYALFDGSMFSHAEIERLTKASLHFHPALPGSPFESLQLQGPLLWAMDDIDPNQLAILLRRTDGIPAFSLIATTKPQKQLSEVLLWLAVVQTQDGQKLHCRFADTRTLPLLLHCLAPDQIAHLATGMDEWLWVTRDGEIETRHFPAQAAQNLPENEDFRLDDAQFDFMLISAEADMVFQMLAEKMPDVLPDSLPHEIHGRISSLLDTARGYGIADLSELFQYAVVALTTRDDFDRHPAIRDTWTRLEDDGLEFSELAEQWPETFWQTFSPMDETHATTTD